MASGDEPRPTTYNFVPLGRVSTKSDLHNVLKNVLASVPAGEYIKVSFTTADSSSGIDSTIFSLYGYYTGIAVRPYTTYGTSIFTNQVGEIITLGYYAGSSSDVVTGWSSKKGGSF